MKTTSIFLACLLIGLLSSGLYAQFEIYAKPGPSLQIQSTDGTNGAAVAWNPNARKYYAVIAGNVEYPIETFSEDGTNIYSTLTGEDYRSMWWNSSSGKLQGTSYAGQNMFDVSLNSGGNAMSETSNWKEWKNPAHSENATGCYDPTSKSVAFYTDGAIYTYKIKNQKAGKSVQIDSQVNLGSINPSTVICTGVKGSEYGLLDFEAKKVLLFNGKTGRNSAEVQLPAEITGDYTWFRFSFANKHVWLFDVEARVWSSYKIMQ